MIVERKSRWKFRENAQNSLGNHEREIEGSRFRVLNNKDLTKENYEVDLPDSRRPRRKEVLIGNFHKDSGFQHNGQTDGNNNSLQLSKEPSKHLGLGVSPNFQA